ncbi:ESF1 homolog [Scaptodrosophila lebanonensis]|uniref:ESF1 homolog n=1 Tax=Drosophila lebanonensis TaxID=7225 RepID=A0A6J2TVQ9_DROLE|nr:ESF1 homolog [Scaptodrosophila lebanonensis]
MAKKPAQVEGVEHPSTSQQAQTIEKTADNGIWKDERFQHLLADPRFRGVPKVQRKVKIDKRFQGMFNDEKFKVKYTVDKYGRPVNKSNAEDLRKFYELDGSSESDGDDNSQAGKTDVKESSSEDEEQQERRQEELAIARDENDIHKSDIEDVDDDEPTTLRERLTNPDIDYARGEGCLVTDSSTGEESSDEEDADGPELQIDHVWGELDNDAETTEESTRRLAVCNMDWDRIRAQDLLVLFSSFLPPGGTIRSVKIYPSEYGKARMAEEEVHGPTELVGLGKDTSTKAQENIGEDSDEELVQEQDSDAEEGDDYHMEKLRQYQLNRLRYYYAVVECDSVATADKVYKECDGIEYESSATRVDLRFIPDDTTFDNDTPRDICTELPDANSYKPRQFTTTALQQAKVDLTWDETAMDRRELGDKLSSGKVDQLNDKELRQIVAYSTEEESEEEGPDAKPAAQSKTQPLKHAKQKERIEMYKGLLAEINEQEAKSKEQKYEMEMSWNIDAPENSQQGSEDENEAEASSKSQLTPIEKVMQKRSEKNKLRKEQRRRKQLEARGVDLAAANDSDDDSIPDGIDMNDAYFADEFANGDYEPPKAAKKLKNKKNKHSQLNEAEGDEERRQQQELALLLDDSDDHESVAGAKKQHFSLTKILKTENESNTKRKRRKQLKKAKGGGVASKELDDNFRLNLDDSRFTAVYKSHEYNIDPTDSHFKGTKGMQQIIGEKLKRRQKQLECDEVSTAQLPKRSKQQLENNLLVNSLKRKIKQQQKL